MDQLVEVTRLLSSEGVHYKVHPLLHPLHLRDHVRWSCFCGGRTTCILSLLSAWSIAAFRPLLVPSLGVGTFLVLLLGVKHHVLLAHLLLEVIILLGELFYYCCKSLNLSLKGGGSWFVPLIVLGGHHRASKYHATFFLGSGSKAYFQSTSFPQTTPIDDAENRQ